MQPLFLFVATTMASLAIGGAFLTGTTALTVTTMRSVVVLRKRIKGQACSSCSGKKISTCRCCDGKGFISYAPWKEAPVEEHWTCPMCKGRTAHKCFNCRGLGVA